MTRRLDEALSDLLQELVDAAQHNAALRERLCEAARAVLERFSGAAERNGETIRPSVMGEFAIPAWSDVGAHPAFARPDFSPPAPPPQPPSLPAATTEVPVFPEGPAAATAPSAPPASAGPVPPGPVLVPPVSEPESSEPLPELTLGQGRKPVDPLPAHWSGHRSRGPGEPEDLALVAQRCRLKADGLRWAVERRRRIASQIDFAEHVAPGDREIIAAAKAIPNCFLWMNAADFIPPADVSLCERLAQWFEAVADTLSPLRRLQDEETPRPAVMEQGVFLLAEGQSALRAAIGPVGAIVDSDQMAIFNWLKEFASRERVFIRRYMRVDDVADPARIDAYRERISEFVKGVDAESARKRATKKLFNKLRYVASQIVKEPASAPEQWEIEFGVLADLLAEGIPPSDKEVREALLPALDHLPDDLPIPEGARLVFRELDRYLAAAEENAAGACRDAPPSEDVAQVRELLEGKTIMLIGGDRREASERALQSAFGLAELDWVVTSEQHQSVSDFESHVSRPETALVLLAIRWSRHAYGDVRHLCEKHGKPLVWLPGGYNPNQVASQIMRQSSDRLSKAHSA